MKLKIQKFNPLLDPEPYYVEGDVEYREYITALDAIYLFHAAIEPINFDYSCGGRICGRCAVMIDGEPKLLCMTVLNDSAHTIEPLAGFPVIRDLIVDKSSFDNAMTNIQTRVMLEPINKETVKPEGFVYSQENEILMRFGELCCRCGMCNITCPAKQTNPDDYAGPAEMFAIGFRHLDWYDKSDRIAQAVSAGMYHCIQCGKCTEVCAYEIDHLSMWTLLRNEAKERNLIPSYAK